MALSDNPIRGEVPAGIRHFAGKKSSEQLAFIDDLHKLGLDKWIELPQVRNNVVVCSKSAKADSSTSSLLL